MSKSGEGMQRRKFLTSAVAAMAASAASTAALARPAAAEPEQDKASEYYLLRRFELRSGAQNGLTGAFIEKALIPALGRMKLGPVGAFTVDIGPETPAYYVLIPGSSLEAVAEVDLKLAMDEEFLKAADFFWSAPAATPAFDNVTSILLKAFDGWPKLTPPAPMKAGVKTRRIYQLRTYESPSFRDHVRKVEMFHKGEFGIFEAAGFHNIFFGDTLAGPRMPSLTYMVCIDDASELNAHWDAFGSNPDWKKLSSDPRYAFEATVSKITNLILRPMSSSQF